MPTIGEAVDWLESDLFVGRERELVLFEFWLTTDAERPEILNVSGRGGIGKSAILRAFARAAARQGKTAILVDGRDIPPTPEGLLAALNVDGAVDVLTHINETYPLILIDTFEELCGLTRYLQERFLPRLATTVKIVIAGRHPFGHSWTESSPWRRVVRPMAIDVLSPTESHEYLHRRGLVEAGLVDQITSTTAGNPLALALAADMALQLGTRSFAAAPEWHLLVRSFVNHFLREVDDPTLRELLEACAVVRRFDEATLAAISGHDNVGDAFDRLCLLSVVRPAERGLMLHDDVRRALSEDLRWRNPDRHNAFRLRALSHFRERMRCASPADREWLLVESFYLHENAFIQAMLFADYEPGQVWIEPCGPEDHEAVMRFWSDEAVPTLAQELGVDSLSDIPAEIRERDEEFIRSVLAYAGTRVHVVRDPDGRVVGFSLAVTLCQEALGLFDTQPALGAVLHAYYSPEKLATLPLAAQGSNVYYLLMAAWGQVLPGAVRAALMRDFFGLLARSGLYFSTAPTASYKAFLEACGFELVLGARNSSLPGKYSSDGYVLDLSSIGVERWVEALLTGRRPVPALALDALERELKAVLSRWQDDAALAESRLGETIPHSAGQSEAERAGALRAAIQRGLARARESATTAEEEALNALDLAYFRKGVTYHHAALRLNVSRSTFYRLIRRGIRHLAHAMSQSQ